MDPDTNLAELRRLTADTDFPEWADEYGDRVAELFKALDEWISKGGFLPQAWSPQPA